MSSWLRITPNNDALLARDRPFSSTAYRADEYIDNGRDRDITFPANIRIGNAWVNPSFATGCMPPFSVPVPGKPWCGYDHLSFINLLPPVERTNVFAGATWQFAQTTSCLLSTSFRTTATNGSGMSSAHTPLPFPPISGSFIRPAAPFYPVEFAAAQGITGDLEVFYRPFPAGTGYGSDSAEAQHLVAGVEGLVGGWNYNAAFIYSQNTVKPPAAAMSPRDA